MLFRIPARGVALVKRAQACGIFKPLSTLRRLSLHLQASFIVACLPLAAARSARILLDFGLDLTFALNMVQALPLGRMPGSSVGSLKLNRSSRCDDVAAPDRHRALSLVVLP